MIRAVIDSVFWDWLTLASVVVGLIGSLFFVVRFQLAVGWSWTRTPFGRFLMTRKANLAALFTVVLVNMATGRDWPAREMVTALLMMWFALQTFVPSRLLMRVNADHADQEDSHA